MTSNWYLILMGVLALVALILVIIIIVVIVKGKKRGDEYDDYDEDYDDEYDDSEDYDDEYDDSEDEYDNEYDDSEDEYDDEYDDSEDEYDDEYDDSEEDYDVEDEYEEEPPKKTSGRRWKIILENLETWEKFDLVFCDNVGIGREKGRDQFEKYMPVREDPRVSKVHCAIVIRRDALYLKDMGSRNGTYLNGIRIQEPVVIQKDDIIGVGGTQIEVKKVLRERR